LHTKEREFRIGIKSEFIFIFVMLSCASYTSAFDMWHKLFHHSEAKQVMLLVALVAALTNTRKEYNNGVQLT
jgi:hypothetical protein